MKKNSLIDWTGFLIFKGIGPLIRLLPLGFVFWLGARLGDLCWLFDVRHRAVAYKNIKIAFGARKTPAQLRGMTRAFYRSFGQNFIELFLVPRIDDAYLEKHVTIEGREHIAEARLRNKGIIFCSVHAGSWELSTVFASLLGLPYSMLVRNQRLPMLERLLNDNRRIKGRRIIRREDEIRQLIRIIRNNETTGMSVDQGGRNGTLVRFFGRSASMSSGAVHLAMKYGASLVPVFITRSGGPRVKIFVDAPFECGKDSETEALQRLAGIFERYITRFPQEFLWTYKTWKFSDERRILVLSDGKTGHLRQSQALAGIAAEQWNREGIKTVTDTADVVFRSRSALSASLFCNIVSGRHICRGCLMCLRRLLVPDSYRRLTGAAYDLVVSCGSSLAAANYLVSRENDCRSVAIMKPSIAALDRFDLVVMPGHDRPPAAPNVVRIEGALNLITDRYLKEQSELLRAATRLPEKSRYVGFLVGGDAKGFSLSADAVTQVAEGLKQACAGRDCAIIAASSRRSPPEIERRLKASLSGNPSTGLLVIASEKNYPFTVGGMLGICSVVVVSPESISMISEAASSKAAVIVFSSGGLSRKHGLFLRSMQDRGAIHYVEPGEAGACVLQLLDGRSKATRLDDRDRVADALKKHGVTA